jgi:hypothetical protein
MKTSRITFVILMALSVCIFSQQKEDYSKYPGYFNYKDFTQLKNAESITEIYLEEPLLKMVAGLAQDKKEGLGDALGGLKLVSVNEYKIPKSDLTNMEDAVESMDGNLKSKGWGRIIRTNSKGNYTNVYIKKSVENEFVGLTIVSLEKLFKSGENSDDSGKATFVNIVGKIDLSTLGKISEQLHVPGLDKAKK